LNASTSDPRFEQIVLPHLDAAYNLARWLTGNDHDAQDVVQESMLRALRFIDSYRGGDSKAWLLMIVRRTCFTWLDKNRPKDRVTLDPTTHDPVSLEPGPDAELIRSAEVQLVHEALAELAPEYREVIVLHELEGLAYKQIATIAEIPLGTVMSRLSRARASLEKVLVQKIGREVRHGMQ
jgi:RNA polymerase sigma-70 factor (ECF subfamily)